MITVNFYPDIVSKVWYIFDQPYDPKTDPNFAQARFHAAQGDYFSTLATILRFYEEAIVQEKFLTTKDNAMELDVIRGVMRDLLYLDKNYDIVPKGQKAPNRE